MAKKSMIARHAKEQKFKVREYNRCPVCGSAHGYYRRFKICRRCFREMAHRGDLPGVRKASW